VKRETHHGGHVFRDFLAPQEIAGGIASRCVSFEHIGSCSYDKAGRDAIDGNARLPISRASDRVNAQRCGLRRRIIDLAALPLEPTRRYLMRPERAFICPYDRLLSRNTDLRWCDTASHSVSLHAHARCPGRCRRC